MYLNKMILDFLNLKTKANHREVITSIASTPFKSSFKDLLGRDVKEYHFDCSSWSRFCEVLNDIPTLKDINLSKKVYSGINSLLKGTYEGISIVYRDSNNLIYHITINFNSECVD
jgi:hypothetical protein